MKGSPLAAALLALLLAQGVRAQTALEKTDVDESDVLVLQVVVDRQPVSDVLTAYQSAEDILLPLGELARLLTLAISTQPAQGTAGGFILKETRSFSLDLGRGVVVLGGKSEPVDPRQVNVQPDDIYVSSRLLARWLPVDLEVDMSRLSLVVRPREQLPLQYRLEREAQGGRVGTRGEEVDRGFPRYDIPYRMLGTPFIDQTLSVDFRGGDGHRDLGGRYTGYATGDLLGMEGALYVNAGSGAEAGDVRLTLGRNDPDAGLLGPLRARTALLGSVPMPGVANISRTSPRGEGVVVSNRPLSQSSSFGQHSLQGPLPPGWDVELYFNDILVGFQSSGPDGQYVFPDQPLLFGPNEFRLVFHGPLGQMRVERETYLLEQSITRPGEFYYSVAQQFDEDGHARTLTQFDWGLNEHLAATGGIVRIPVDGENQVFSNLGLLAHWQSVILHGELVKSQNGGSFAQATLRTRLGKWSVTASHAGLRGYTSELFLPSADPVRSVTAFRADGAVSLPAMRLPVTLEASRERRKSGAGNINAAGRVSARMRGTSVTGQFRWHSFDGREVADATLQMSRRVGGVSFRSQVNYAFAPQSSLTAVALSADKRLGTGYLLSTGITRLFNSSETLVTAGLTKSLGSYGLGINTGYSTSGDMTVGLRLFLAMGREPRGSGWRFSALPMAGAGAVSALAFLDDNMNGLMDPGEEPIEGVGFTVNGGKHPVATNAQGIAYLERLPVMRPTNIALIPESLEDPQWQTRIMGMRLVPRPGAVAELLFPVIMTSEIDGTVYLLEGMRRREMGNLQLEVVDAAGRVVATGTSAADGYYVVVGVPAGQYQLRVSPEQMARLGLLDTDTHPVTVSRDGAFVGGIDIELRAKPD